MSGVIDLSSGQVIEPLAEPALKALAETVSAREVTAYAASGGESGLRSAVAAHYARRVGSDVDPEQITVTAGARHGLFSVAAASAADGEILVPEPRWSHYPEMLRIAGARPVPVPGDPANGWLPDPDRLEAARTARTKAVVVNSPVNPTGAVYDTETLAAIRAWCAQHGLLLVVDDIYWAYGGEDAGGVRAGACEVVVGGASKVHALAGLRVGWVWADAALTAAVRTIVEHTTGPVSTLAQPAVAAVLDRQQDAVPDRVRRLDALREHAVRTMSAVPAVRVIVPRGGIYLCLDTSGLAKARPEWRDDRVLCAALAEHAGVRLRPGSTFGLPGHVRLCVAAAPGLLSEAAGRLSEFLGTAAIGAAGKSEGLR